MRLAGLASDSGRLLTALADRRAGDVEVALVVSDDPDAPVLDAADDRGIPTEVVDPEDDCAILDWTDAYDVELLLDDGFAVDFSDEFCADAPPVFGVASTLDPAADDDPVAAAIDEGRRITGATVCLLDDDGTWGPILTQEPVPVYEDDDRTALADRIREDAAIPALERSLRWYDQGTVTVEAGRAHVDADRSGEFPARWLATGDRAADLRYGENPHQDAALYGRATPEASVVDAEQLNEGAKALSYNNYNDADAALNLVKEFDRPAAAVIKHTNPAGCAVGEDVADAYDRALSTDPMSAYGGIVALNRECDRATAEAITDSFKEVVVAPGYADDALDALFEKDNLRVLDVGSFDGDGEGHTEKRLVGGRLIQERDDQRLTPDDLEFVTEREPTEEQVESMLFAWQTIKHVKSNAILFAQGTETVGVGAGQVSRVDAVRIARMKADEHAEGKSADGAVMASDAFFPFPDGVEEAAEAGIEAVIQPGGSKNDDKVIEAADDLGIAMAFTGQRCFRHD